MTTETEGLDLRKYTWPKVTGSDVVFPTADTDKVLLAEAKRRGYDDYPEKSGTKMFNTLFFKGGRIKYREDVPEEHVKNVYAYLRSFMGSWAPKHEHKRAVCGMLLDEIATGVEEVQRVCNTFVGSIPAEESDEEFARQVEELS